MKKNLRDIQKPTESSAENILDLSGLDTTNIIVTDQSQRTLSEKTVFRQIDLQPRKPIQRAGELIRLAAAGMLILFVLNSVNIYHRGKNIQSSVIASAFEGYNNLLAGKDQTQQKNFTTAGTIFATASENFSAALKTIDFLSTNQSLFFAGEKTVQSVQNILEAGKNIAQAGENFTKGINNIQNLPQLILQTNDPKANPSNLGSSAMQTTQPLAPALQTTDYNLQPNKPSLTTTLKEDIELFNQAAKEIEIASDHLAIVDTNILPLQFREKFKSLQPKIETLKNLLGAAQEKIPVLLKLLGDRYPHRYLVLLQNDTEARPTGGFIGSYLLVDFNDGYLTKMDFHDVYESDGQLNENIPAPEDIATITKNWRLRDSNYSPDFAISAEKAAWFLQKEKGPSVDTVIALNQHFLANLLEITGPITLDGLNKPLTKDNYQLILSYIIESKLSGDQDPKKILREFIPAFQKKLLDTHGQNGASAAQSGTLEKTITTLLKGLERKDIMLYSRDEEIQKFFEEAGFAGHVIRNQQNEDYLSVITTSIGGNKSDLYIKQALQHTTIIGEEGDVNDEIIITRQHQWGKDALASIRATLKSFGFEDLSETVKFILGAGENKSIVKVYVPLGSKLVAANGIDQAKVALREDQEIQKTYFMFEMDTAPGKTTTVSLSYQLPQNLKVAIADSYHFFVQKQSGITVSHLEKKILLKPPLSLYATYPENLKNKPADKNVQAVVSVDQDLEKDLYVAALIGH